MILPDRKLLGVAVYAALLATTSRLAAADVARLRPTRVIQLEGQPPQGYPPVVTVLQIHPDGRRLVIAGDDHQVRLWHVAGTQPLQTLRGHHDWVRCASFSPDGGRLTTAGNDRRVLVWDVEGGQLLRELPTFPQAVGAAVYSGDGRWLAVAGFQNQMRIYDAADGRLVRELACPCRDMRAVAFSPDGRRLAAGGRNGRLRVWSLTEDWQSQDAPAHAQRIHAVTFTADSRHLISAGEDRTVRGWNAADLSDQFTLARVPGKVLALALVPPDRIALAGSDNVVWLWSLATRQPVGRLEGHTGSVAAVAVHDRLLATGGYDGTVCLWQLDQAPELAGNEAGPGVQRQ